MIALLLALLLSPAYAQQPAPPDWQNKAIERAAPQTLIDADTHQQLVITDEERAVIVHAMETMQQIEPNRKELGLYQAGITRIKNGAPLTMGDVILLNGPLMMVQSNPEMSPAEIALIKPLLRRIRKAASAMASNK